MEIFCKLCHNKFCWIIADKLKKNLKMEIKEKIYKLEAEEELRLEVSLQIEWLKIYLLLILFNRLIVGKMTKLL